MLQPIYYLNFILDLFFQSRYNNYLNLITGLNMEKQIYIITYSSAHYCGYPSNCLVLATDEDDAVAIADQHMYETEYEQNSDQFEEDGIDADGDMIYMVDKVELLAGSEFEEFEKDEGQRFCYPKINF